VWIVLIILAICAVVAVPIVGLLAAIAIPNFVKARQASQRAACVANLKTIQGAKETWALEHKKLRSDTPAEADLFGPTRYIQAEPACPANGTYSINAVSQKPTCTIPGHGY
jgi:competence protein ComGC